MDSEEKGRKGGRINCGILDYSAMKISLKPKKVVQEYLNVISDFHLAKCSDYDADNSGIFKYSATDDKAENIYSKPLVNHPTEVEELHMKENNALLGALYSHYSNDLEKKIMYERDIVTILVNMKFEVGHKGFFYIKDIMLYCFRHGIKNCKIALVYDLVAKAYGISPKTVEKSVRSQISTANYYRGLENMKNMSGLLHVNKYPPTNCEFIFGCMEILPYLLIKLSKEKIELEYSQK